MHSSVGNPYNPDESTVRSTSRVRISFPFDFLRGASSVSATLSDLNVVINSRMRGQRSWNNGGYDGRRAESPELDEDQSERRASPAVGRLDGCLLVTTRRRLPSGRLRHTKWPATDGLYLYRWFSISRTVRRPSCPCPASPSGISPIVALPIISSLHPLSGLLALIKNAKILVSVSSSPKNYTQPAGGMP